MIATLSLPDAMKRLLEEKEKMANTPAYEDDNIFAKILRGDLPATTVFEDDHCIVIMDVMPVADGHCLIIPKRPSRNLIDADPGVLSHLIKVVQRMAKAAKTAFDADGIRVMQFNESAAGQSVFHLHFHVIPMHEGTELRPHAAQMADADLLKDHAEKLKAVL